MSWFEGAYAGTPPWDIGRPQEAMVRLAEHGEIRGHVLDVGCGTGENALYLASLGLQVLGVDAAPTAIERARAKAEKRGSSAEFLVGDVLELPDLGRTFDTAIDSGLFHTLGDEERPRFAASLHAVLTPGGRYFLLCWSERVPGILGPRRVTQAEVRDTFTDGWTVDSIEESAFESNLELGRIHAWLARISRD